MACALRFLRENVCDLSALRCCSAPPQHTGDLPVVKDLVLIGGGHCHVHVLRMLGMSPMEGVRVTLIARDLETPYSGMLPGHVAGHYSRDECHIDLVPLAQFAKARIIHAAANGIDLDAKRVSLDGARPAIAYDFLSIDIGSAPQLLHTTPAAAAAPAAAPAAAAPVGEKGGGGVATAAVTPVKPIDGFGVRWQAIVVRVAAVLEATKAAVLAAAAAGAPPPPPPVFALVVVGGGAGGTELVLAMQFRLRAMMRDAGVAEVRAAEGAEEGGGGAAAAGAPSLRLAVSLVTRGPSVLPTHNARVRAKFRRILRERSVALLEDSGVEEVQAPAGGSGSAAEGSGATGGALLLVGGSRRVAFDECVWCTGGGAQAWLRDVAGLPLDERGFIAVEPTLQCLGAASSAKLACVYACGDVASVVQHPRPKAGVFAVRQGPPLLRNLRRAVLNRRPVPFVPQRDFLSIVSTGDCYAVWSRGSAAAEGARVWRVKDWIDRKWLRMYKELPRMAEPEVRAGAVARADGADTLAVLAKAPMRCGGCGSKVGSTVLSAVMARLRREGMLFSRPEVLVGLDSPDDAAVVSSPPPGWATVHTVDFFRSFIDDPFVFGRIAANHALSDCHAMCAEPVSALAMVVIPYGLEAKVEELLFQVMAGACSALTESRCALVGGHTTEGAELTLGFAVNGVADPAKVLAKGGMKVGEALIVTKPVGTGALFAAAMRSQAKGSWVGGALAAMQQSNMVPATILQEHGASCATDVTGFGLLGHLVEMTKASGVHVRLDLGAVPFLAGARECVASGIFSSLQGSNLRLKRAVENGVEAAAAAPLEYALAYDPQTAGGVMATVPMERAEACLAALRAHGCAEAAVIGEVLRASPVPNASGECVTCTWGDVAGGGAGAAPERAEPVRTGALEAAAVAVASTPAASTA